MGGPGGGECVGPEMGITSWFVCFLSDSYKDKPTKRHTDRKMPVVEGRTTSGQRADNVNGGE